MLRITAGEHRGRRLEVPSVASTRPLLARAREALMDRVADLVPDAVVWDVFAGSGILGFEALSRGAARVLAVERHPRAGRQLQANAELLGCADRLILHRRDAREFLDLDPPPDTPDLVFFDPPYAAFRGPGRTRVWELFCACAQRLRPGGCAIVHTPQGILTSAERARLPGLEERQYGTTSLYSWRRPRTESDAQTGGGS